MDDQMSEEEFSGRLLTVLGAGESFNRAVAIFKLAGAEWGLPIVDAMSHAADKGVVVGTLQLLEKHFQSSPLRDPEACHSIEVFINPRTGVFLRIDGRSVT